MNPIDFGQPTAYQSNPVRLPSAPARADDPSNDDLRADASSSGIGALGAYAAQFSATPITTATSPIEQDPSSVLSPLESSSGSSPTAFTPPRSWTSMLGQGPGGTPAGSAADQGMSQILDAGDVFDTSDD